MARNMKIKICGVTRNRGRSAASGLTGMARKNVRSSSGERASVSIWSGPRRILREGAWREGGTVFVGFCSVPRRRRLIAKG